MKACASMSGGPIDGSAGETGSLPGSRRGLDGRTDGCGRTVTVIICLDTILDAAPASAAPAAVRRGERCQLDLDRHRRRRTLLGNNEDVVEQGESPEIMRLLSPKALPCWHWHQKNNQHVRRAWLECNKDAVRLGRNAGHVRLP